ncbi:hypothetical protein BSN85_25160 [Bradyrhizobium brasilense]|nr:hypothetical protein BSN85_25160 [Bradyrhizobium brasilense]
MDTGSREENASKQESRAPFRFHRNGKALVGRGTAISLPAVSPCRSSTTSSRIDVNDNVRTTICGLSAHGLHDGRP